MNPPASQGPDYDRGYADGYRDRGVEQVIIDLRDLNNVRSEDIEYIVEMCERLPASHKKILGILQ